MAIQFDEKKSLNRPAWTSTVETGNMEAYNHLHTGNTVIKDYYKNIHIR